MKLSIKQAAKLLKDLGVNVEVVESEDKADKDVDVESLVSEVTSNVRETIEPEIKEAHKEEVERGLTGKIAGTLRTSLGRAFGVPGRELERLTKDLPLSEAIETLANNCKKIYDDKSGKEKQDWETEREEMIKEHETALEALRTEKDNEVTTWKSKYADRDINESLIKITEKIPRVKGEVTEHADYLRYKAQKQGYELKYNETASKLELWKDGRKARVNNKDLEIEDLAKQVFTESGMMVTDTSHIKPSDAKAGIDTGVKAGIEPISVNNNVPDNFAGLAAELQDA